MEQPANMTYQNTVSSPVYLAPVLPADGPIPAELDRQLVDIARNAGCGDLIARDSLYWAVAGRLEPSVRRIFWLHAQTYRHGYLELEDVRQSSYLVFVEMINSWRPEDSFANYLFGMFGWRLRYELRSFDKRREVPMPTEHSIEAPDSAPGVETLERLLDRLPDRQRRIVNLRLSRNLTFMEIGETLGVSPRTIRRDMHAIARAVKKEVSV